MEILWRSGMPAQLMHGETLAIVGESDPENQRRKNTAAP
jgi:hypothetical protein